LCQLHHYQKMRFLYKFSYGNVDTLSVYDVVRNRVKYRWTNKTDVSKELDLQEQAPDAEANRSLSPDEK
jgi:hypothetical protein